MEITLKVKRVTVLTNLPGTDHVRLTLDASTPYPNMGYDGSAVIETAAGYGIEWCRKVLSIDPEVIDAKTGEVTHGQMQG